MSSLDAIQVAAECAGIGGLALLFWLSPQRHRSPLIAGVYRRLRPWLGRVGLAHAPWTMFASQPNRNHFCVLRIQSAAGMPAEESRDDWRLGRWWGDLVDERPRRILVALVRSDTGPHTKRSLAEGFVRWCFRERRSLPAAGSVGTVVFGQEVFRSPGRRTREQPEPEVVVKYTLTFKVGADGQLEFVA